VLLHSVCNSACTVEGQIAARTASVRKRAAQISIAHCAGVATPVALLHQWNHCICGRAAELASAYAFATRPAMVELLRPFTLGLHANSMEYARKPSQRLSPSASSPTASACAATVEVDIPGSLVPLAIASCSRHKSQLGFFRRSQARR
jgi:hypothetical protein